MKEEDEGSAKLRFWRGNETTLWNSSALLSYEEYASGNNCVKVTGWDETGELSVYQVTLDVEKDTDDDGAPDYVEDYFETDKTKADTDGDGLSDYIELYSVVLNPCLVDTDENGTNDGDEDLDGDGLTNIREIELGTDLLKTDTDNDGLSDYEENAVYGTNPLKTDTDEDGVSDAKEIALSTNALVVEDSFDVSVTADEEDTVKVSVEAELSGEQVETLTVERYEDELFFPETMPGYIGGAYDFHVDGSFDSATIQFEFDESLLEDEDFDPVIYYFNEETQLLEELETTITDNIASAEVTHFSKYILLNRKVYQESFIWQDVWGVTGYTGVELVLVIDDSGSMTTYDSANQRLTVARNLIDKLPDNSKIGIVKFESSTSILTPTLIDDKDQAKAFLTTDYFYSSGNTTMYSAVISGTSLFESTDDTVLKTMVVISDGIPTDESLYTLAVSAVKDNNVKVYTVGLGSNNASFFTRYLQPLSNNTGGAFYLASDADQLEKIYDDINMRIDIETDSDEDGIADYYEENMVMFNGVTLKLDKNNPDSDGDGLDDGEEVVELNYQYNIAKTQVIVTGKLLSDPLHEDSDGDGISDEEETNIGTDPRIEDTDGDGLADGTELVYWFDPLVKDPDGDGRTDYQEYVDGTDPFSYNKDWYEYVWDFTCGFALGDIITETDSIATTMGQITGSLIPVADVRDLVANAAHGDYALAGISAIGVVPLAGDVTKTATKVGKFIVKNADDVPKVAALLEFLSKNFPDVVTALSKSDDFADAAKQLSKGENLKLIRQKAHVITESFEHAGLSHYLLKTSNSLNIKSTVDVSQELGENVWEQGACKRGKNIDIFINKHDGLNGLGENFPVADRVDDGILVSTKSTDVGAPSYQNTTTLKNRLNKYVNDLINFEKKYFKGEDEYSWGESVLRKEQYNNKKALEIVLPDVIITEDALTVLTDFKTTMEKSDIEVWYIIAK